MFNIQKANKYQIYRHLRVGTTKKFARNVSLVKFWLFSMFYSIFVFFGLGTLYNQNLTKKKQNLTKTTKSVMLSYA
jgi:hypothetical protein